LDERLLYLENILTFAGYTLRVALALSYILLALYSSTLSLPPLLH
jgi:hypothetical protein